MRVWASPTLSDYSELAFLIHHILLERQFLFCVRWPSVGSVEESSIYQQCWFTRERASRFLDTQCLWPEKQERRRVPPCLKRCWRTLRAGRSLFRRTGTESGGLGVWLCVCTSVSRLILLLKQMPLTQIQAYHAISWIKQNVHERSSSFFKSEACSF